MLEIQAYLDNELGSKAPSRLLEHVGSCKQCKEVLKAMQTQGDLIRQEIQDVVNEVDFSSFEDRVMEQIHLQKPLPLKTRFIVGLREALYHYRAIWITSLVTAAVLLLVLLPFKQTPTVVEQVNTTQVASNEADDVDVDVDNDNQVIIDAIEYAGQKSMIFTVSKNDTTVIWLYDFDEAENERILGDDI
jgi:urease accessory protein UreF